MDLNQEVVLSTDIPADSRGEKRPYVEPVLMEWGSLVDLTRGPIVFLPDDAEFTGTSNPES